MTIVNRCNNNINDKGSIHRPQQQANTNQLRPAQSANDVPNDGHEQLSTTQRLTNK
jgi:hypothetical protein